MMIMARGFPVDMAGRNVLGFAYGCAIVSAFSMGCGAVLLEQSGRKYMESKSCVLVWQESSGGKFLIRIRFWDNQKSTLSF